MASRHRVHIKAQDRLEGDLYGDRVSVDPSLRRSESPLIRVSIDPSLRRSEFSSIRFTVKASPASCAGRRAALCSRRSAAPSSSLSCGGGARALLKLETNSRTNTMMSMSDHDAIVASLLAEKDREIADTKREIAKLQLRGQAFYAGTARLDFHHFRNSSDLFCLWHCCPTVLRCIFKNIPFVSSWCQNQGEDAETA